MKGGKSILHIMKMVLDSILYFEPMAIISFSPFNFKLLWLQSTQKLILKNTDIDLMNLTGYKFEYEMMVGSHTSSIPKNK